LKKKKIHLYQTQQKPPTPLTPVDEAWVKMAELLDSEIPVSVQKSNKRVFAISFSQFVVFVMAAMILVGGGTFIMLKRTGSKNEIHAINHSIKQTNPDSLINKTVLTEDSAISTKTDVQTNRSANQKANEENLLPKHQNNGHTSLSTALNKALSSHRVLTVKESNLNKVIVDNSGIKTNNHDSNTSPVEKQHETAYLDSVNSQNRQLNSTSPQVVDNYGIKTNKQDNITNPVEKRYETVFIDSVNSQNYQLNGILPKDKNIARVELRSHLNESLGAERNLPIRKLPTKEKEKKENGGNKYPKTNHLFVGLSGYNGLLFSKTGIKNIYSYGEILTFGIRNTKYNLTVETGLGFQTLEYHVPFSRTLYTYQATGIYDSTKTVSSYKYSRYNVIIPFYITKEIFHYNNIFFDVKMGINTSVFLSKQRLFNQVPADIKLVEDAYPISKLNFSFSLSPQLRWDINDKFSFYINAGGEFYLNSLYQNFSLKPIGVNLSAGIHYIF